MRLKEELVQRLAEKIYNDLSSASLITPRHDRGSVVAGMVSAIVQNMNQEQALERDAERILNENLAGMGRAALEIDRRTMLKMIKNKLAKERKIIL